MIHLQRLAASMLKRAQRKSWKHIKKYCPTYISKSDRFRELVLSRLESDMDMIDLGCGRGLETAISYKELTRHSYGLDISEAVYANSTIHEPLLGSVYDIPLPNGSVDLAVNQELLEHLEFPERMFQEVSRILRPNGIFAAMTPNIWYPSMMVSYVTPYSFHKFVNRVLHNIDARDVFPTWYRANTLGRLKRLGKSAGLDIVQYEYFTSNPGELSFSPLLTRLEVAYYRLLVRFEALGWLRDVVIVFFRKPA